MKVCSSAFMFSPPINSLVDVVFQDKVYFEYHFDGGDLVCLVGTLRRVHITTIYEGSLIVVRFKVG